MPSVIIQHVEGDAEDRFSCDINLDDVSRNNRRKVTRCSRRIRSNLPNKLTPSRNKRKATHCGRRIRSNLPNIVTPFSQGMRGKFVCGRCYRSYKRKDTLQRHLTYECGKDPQFQCPFCPKKFKRKSHLMRHTGIH